MRLSGKQTRRAVSLLLCLALLVSMLAFALTVRAEEVEEFEELEESCTYTDAYDSSDNNTDEELTKSEDLADTGASLGYIYCKNTAGWASVSAYMWIKDTQTNNGNWPGKGMTNVSGDIWRYEVTNSSWNMIIFNNNNNGLQTTDLDYPGAGYIYDNSTEKWSVYETYPTTQSPTTGGGTNPTTAVQPTTGGSSTDKTYVYCENDAGWSTVTAYMWVGGSTTDNNGWPGKPMTNIGGNTWRYEVPKSTYNMIIFSENGAHQTADLSFSEKNYYNNQTNTWDVYDTSPLQISKYATDVQSPQFAGVGITLSAEAVGQGNVYYKFSVTNGSSTTVLSDFSTASSVQWIPQTAGTYTITYDFKDDAKVTNQRTKTFVIEDGSQSVAPFIKVVTPNGGEIQNGSNVNMTVSAGGGRTGTNLLFYKYTIKNPNGDIVNTPYYTRNTTYTFRPTDLGLYTATVDVQGSDNKTVQKSYLLNSVGTVVPTEPPVIPTESPDQPTEAPAPTEAPTEPSTVSVLYGDADDNGRVTIMDATYVQRYDIGIALPSPLNERNADVDGDGKVKIFDATHIQRFDAGIISVFPAEQ